jgi:mannose-1-phosphate guanylyltransferase
MAKHALILAGGRGTRFWPRSRKARAKQVLSFDGERTLIQQTVDRLVEILPAENIWILTNDHLRQEIVKQLPNVPARQILAEPAQRNTAPAIGLAAHLIGQQDPEAVMGVFPADHVITKPKRFLRFVKPAYAAAAKGRIVVLGIQPRWAETGYGYIEFPDGFTAGATAPFDVVSFREKPNQATAEEFLATGRFSWNAGMFFWKTSVLLATLNAHLPKTAALIQSLPGLGSKKFKAELAKVFPQCENISIDYAVMEPASRARPSIVSGLATDDIGWNDVGSWNAVYELLAAKRDKAGNVGRVGTAITLDSQGNYVDVEKKLVALVGVKDLVVVDTPDALLVCDRNQAQKVGDLVKMLEAARRDDLL